MPLRKLKEFVHRHHKNTDQPVLPSYDELMSWENYEQQIKTLDEPIMADPKLCLRLAAMGDDDLNIAYNDLFYSYSFLYQEDLSAMFNPYPVLREIAVRHVLAGTDVLSPEFTS
ncbi:MAG: hypothetical protein WBP26_02180 [Candidatus Saccharimonadales bacterium]